ncbi:MAG: D-alanine--D-alanine ligase [Bacteroidia bacterium]|nr:D-alanine--D-alanine ligase [Bacteroidia bacterium]
MRIGIFFGGNSREREVSFAGGRTVYDNLDKTIFEAVPIFVDSFNNFILLDWHLIYKGSIRDFYPSVNFLQAAKQEVQVYAESLKAAYADNGKLMASKIGKLVRPDQFKALFDFAFLALHGNFGEDGTIQGLLEWYAIPYSGSGILPSAAGMNKRLQKQWMKAAGMNVPKYYAFDKSKLANLKQIFADAKEQVGIPFVVKPANQGSSVGVSVISTDEFEVFETAVKKAFFIQIITKKEWVEKSKSEKTQFIQKITNVKEGIGLPAIYNRKTYYHPDKLWLLLDKTFKTKKSLQLESIYSETECLIESFIEGREFSCIVLRNEDGSAVALPPTEIVKGREIYDYRSKYLPGLSRKITPMDLPEEKIQEIRKACEHLFTYFNFHVYARIDGFLNANGELFLNDPNTTSGMMPSSFFFHQAAEIGLNPSQFLTYIIRTSVAERIATQPMQEEHKKLLDNIEAQLTINKSKKATKKRVAVFMGGYSTERHISVESGRNIYEKLASSDKYQPFPVFVTGNDQHHELYLLPVNVMLKDNADDIREKVMHYHQAPIMKKIIAECKSIINKYSNSQLFEPKKISYAVLKNMADTVFIALHGRPGEDGTVQKELHKIKLPFNGSDVQSSQLTINKFDTNELLKKNGFLVAEHMLVQQKDFILNQQKVINKAEKIGYPLIAKPADDGCSSAVKKIKNREQLIAYAEGVFRQEQELNELLRARLKLAPKEEFPRKNFFLVEKFIEKGKATHFLEVTGGMLTHYKNKKLVYETFEPSETLAEAEILSLEEKFLAGQGQNITPARYAASPKYNAIISAKVQEELKAAAKVLKVEGYCRIDAFVRVFPKNKIEVVFIEVNSLPGMTPATAIFHQCALSGYKPYEFIDRILNFGEQRLLINKKIK